MANGDIYHVFNRTIAKENVFHSLGNIQYVLLLIDYYRYRQKRRFSNFRILPRLLQYRYLQLIKQEQPLVSIYAYCLMPNHFHFLIKQNTERGIIQFTSNLQNSYAKYYNLLLKRTGALFQNKFKAKRISNETEFIHVARYIHLNLVTSSLIEFQKLSFSPFSSYQSYLYPEINHFVDTKLLYSHFKTPERLIEFTKNQVDYQRSLKLIKDKETGIDCTPRVQFGLY